MITENLSTLRIHKLTQAQYNRAVEEGNIEQNAIYITPDDASVESAEFITVEDIDTICGTTIEGGNGGVNLTFNKYTVIDDGIGNITISEGE